MSTPCFLYATSPHTSSLSLETATLCVGCPRYPGFPLSSGHLCNMMGPPWKCVGFPRGLFTLSDTPKAEGSVLR